MDTEPRYALEKLDQVLRALGCTGQVSKLNRITIAWSNPGAAKGRCPSVATFTPERDQLSIRQDHVVAIAIALDLDPDDVLQRLKRLGGELLEP
ncbi:MAG: hypothetical protein ACT4OI_09260 [Methanobacteriota archaeon]